jgi:hypothetical protein
MIDYGIQESFCEFAQTVQSFIGQGWRIVDVKYGEQKFGIGTTVVAERNNERRNFSPAEIEEWVRTQAVS